MNNQAEELMITYLFLDFILFSYSKNKKECIKLEDLCRNYMLTFLPHSCLHIFDKELSEFCYNKEYKFIKKEK